jgi:hypothetical protein
MQTKTIFLQSGRKIHVGTATVAFLDEGVTISRAEIPDRIIPYSKLNIDRLFSLACQTLTASKQRN